MPKMVVGNALPTTVPELETTGANGKTYHYVLEPELAGASIPRVARPTKSATFCVKLLWNFLLVTVGILVFFAQRDFDSWNGLLQRGVVAQATAYNAFVTQGKTSASFITYQFTTDTGAVAFTKRVNYADYLRMHWGDTLTVTYLPGSRGKVWQEGHATPDQRNANLAVWLFATTIGGGFWYLCIIAANLTNQKHLRFLQQGVAVPTVIRACEITASGNMSIYTVRYSYWTGDKKRNGELAVSGEQYEKLNTGNPYFTVLYDASDPSEHIPYFQITGASLLAK